MPSKTIHHRLRPNGIGSALAKEFHLRGHTVFLPWAALADEIDAALTRDATP